MPVFPRRQEFDGGLRSPFSDERFSIVALEEEQRHTTALDVEPNNSPSSAYGHCIPTFPRLDGYERR